ncbi:response regulator [Belnapia sp. T6]|uniref:histidine kinase n=1 Tax=Belnapia mucosa TaxID=2804532 RepID=A0ABS1UXK5_9PROT|nr:ATP-binding protein [Belnapia mucosa]MBL6454130.1 response regulator [Belnapia mucosa]
MAERLLRRGREAEAFRTLFAAAPDGMALLDHGGAILAANPALGRLAGPALALRPGLPATRLLAPADRPGLEALLAGRATAPLCAHPADPAAPPDAEWSVTAETLPLGGRRLLRILDRTAERRAEARLAAGARLEVIGRLAGGIAHDFNNLLGIILGGTAAARAAAPGPAVTTELAAVEDAARRGAALVGQLLAFARQQRLQPRIIELNAAITGLAPLLRRLLGEGVRLDLALEEPGRRVRVDPAQLDQVLLNLAANAREAMLAGGVLTIGTTHALVLGEGDPSLPPGRYAVLEVRDTGCGIPPEALPRLFEPFFTTRPERGGTGLGLATVQGIVAQSGGRIAVESTPGVGTCFRIHLPRQEGPVDQPAVPPAAVPAPGSGPLLLVEDEAPLRRLAERVLARAGHEVLPAESAEAALDLLEDSPPPALLVSDVAMPGMDGVELARRLRQRWPSLPVVLLSGYAEAALAADLAGEGFRFLAKPYAPAELLAALGTAGQPA